MGKLIVLQISKFFLPFWSVSLKIIVTHKMVNWRGWGGVGREPPDAMSLRYAVNEPPLNSTAFFKSWFL